MQQGEQSSAPGVPRNSQSSANRRIPTAVRGAAPHKGSRQRGSRHARRVTLTAAGVQVTAGTEREARRFAAEDAREFATDWAYEVRSAEPAPPEDELTANHDDREFRLELVNSQAGRRELWTFTLVTEVVVEAVSLEEARDLASLIPRSTARLTEMADAAALPQLQSSDTISQ